MKNFNILIERELCDARMKFPNFHSAHEAYAVILEEIDEFWDETRKGQKKRNPLKMLSELVQIAAMARRAAEDLNLFDTDYVP